VTWGSTPPSCNISKYLVFTGQENLIIGDGSLWNFRFRDLSLWDLNSPPACRLLALGFTPIPELSGAQASQCWFTEQKYHRKNRLLLRSESSTVSSRTSRQHGIPCHMFKWPVLSLFLDVNCERYADPLALLLRGKVRTTVEYQPSSFPIECGCSSAPFTAIYYYHIKNYYCINNIFVKRCHLVAVTNNSY